MEELI